MAPHADKYPQDHKMKMFLILPVLLFWLHVVDATPSNRWSCYKRDCRDVGLKRMRPIDSLQDHYWDGNGCATVCYCHFTELLCCPRDVFFEPKISAVIPCNTSEPEL